MLSTSAYSGGYYRPTQYVDPGINNNNFFEAFSSIESYWDVKDSSFCTKIISYTNKMGDNRIDSQYIIQMQQELILTSEE